MASSWTLAKNTQDSVAEKEAKGSATENGKKSDEVEEVSVFTKQRSKPSLRLSIFRKKNNSSIQKSTPDGTSGSPKAILDGTSDIQKSAVGGTSGKISARRTSSLGVDGIRSSSPVQKKITSTLSGGGLPLKARFRYSFRQPKQNKKNFNPAFNPITASPPTVLTPENRTDGEGGGESSINKETHESSTMSKKSSFEEQLLSAVQPSSLPTRLRKLSKAFFNSQNGGKIDLMNDWEIGGTQNPWVCPSDRHLQLRAQLKSGWSVRTASARSPTNIKQTVGGISDAEQEQIRKVLARAEAGKMSEQQRIGKMVDRLEKMRSRATGNGVTQCLLCQTDFGLLASKSYAAMCMDCRKYVCQKNCGVETYDQKRGEPIFLCKICSEYREVMWKKSGAWFYKEMPTYVKPTVNGNTPGPGTSQKSFWQHYTGSSSNLQNLASTGLSTLSLQEPSANQAPGTSSGNYSNSNASPRVSRQLPIPPDQRLKTTPRPRITPSWVHDKVQSSMSIGSEEEESSSSSVEPTDFKQNAPNLSASNSSRRYHHFHRPKDLNRFDGPSSSVPSSHHTVTSTQRFAAGNRNQITDTDDSENDESRRTTPSTSPRHSLATPSSYGGDDISQNQVSLAANEASDARSIDSGVVQSDHSAQQPQLHQSSSNNLTMNQKTGNPQTESFKLSTGEITPKPKIPPGPPQSGSSQNIERSTSSASSSTASSSALFHNIFPTMPHRESVGPSPIQNQGHRTSQQSQESSTALSARITESSRRSESTHSNDLNQMNSSVVSDVDNSLQIEHKDNAIKLEESASPTFMSSPEDDTSTLGSIQFNLTYLHEDKQLIIHLIRAKNLKAMDKNGFSDPYVKFHIIPGNAKATKLTSKTIEKTLNPEWHEELIYYGITEEDRLKKTLRITVLDRDRIGSDFLGETRVALKKLPLGQMKKFNLYLEHAMPTPTEKTEEIERGKILIAICYNIQQGSLFVHIKRCAELLGMDSTGFSDPYCKVSLTPLNNKSHRQKTAIKKRTLNPEFNETLQFIVPFKDLPKKTLEIGVYDHDVGKHDDYIGGIVLSTAAKGERGKQWTNCIENPGKTFESWHKLDPNT